MKNKIFDVSLWKEGLRQLKIMGIMYFLITAAVAVLLPLGVQQSAARYSSGVERFGFLEMSVFLLLIAFVGVPLMVFYLYRFLTTRDGSDFYHSVPHTRTCLFMSFTGSVMTWFFALVAIYLGIVIALFGLFPDIELSFTNAGVLICSYLAAGILMLGIALLAVSLTGTTLTNLAVFAMIAVLPRLVLTVSYLTIMEHIDFVVVGEIRGFLNPKHNLLFGIMYCLFDGNLTDPLYSWGSVAYSAVLGLLYLGTGWYLFLTRKSEKAGQTAIHPVLSLIFRLLPAFVVCLLPLTAILSALQNGDSIGRLIADNWFEILVFYVIAVLVYLLYELITTKKLSAMVKSLPGLVFLVVMNIGYGAVFFVATDQLYTYQPKAEELDGVRYVKSGYQRTYVEYYEKIAGEVVFQDEELFTILCDAMEETRVLWKNNRGDFNRKVYQESYEYIPFEFVENGKIHGRRVILSQEDADRLYAIMGEEIAQHEENAKLPDWKNVVYYNVDANNNYMEISEKDARALYEALKLDVSNMDYSQWKQLAGEGSDLTARFEFEMSQYPGCTLYLDVPIRSEFPTLYQAFVERYLDYTNTESMEAMVEQLETLDEFCNGDMNFRMWLYKDGMCIGGREASAYSNYKYTVDDVEASEYIEKYGWEDWDVEGFAETIDSLQPGTKEDRYMIQMSMYMYHYDEEEGVSYSTLRIISEEDYEKLKPYMSWVQEEVMVTP